MSHAADSTETAATRDIVAVNHWLSVTRLRAVVGIAVFAIVTSRLGIGDIDWRAVAAVCLGLACFSGAAITLRLERTHPWPCLYAQTVVDWAAITVGIAVGVRGEPAVIFSALYILVIVPAALISVRAGLAATLLATGGHLILLNLHRDLGGVIWSLDGIAPIFLFFMVAQQSFFYAGHMDEKNVELGRLARGLEAGRRRLEGLVRIAHGLNSTLDAPELLRRTNQAAHDHLEASTASIFLVDRQHETFRLAALSAGSLDESPLARIDFPCDAFPLLARLERDPVVRMEPEDLAQVHPSLTLGRSLASGWLAGLYRDQRLEGFLAVGYVDHATPPEGILIDQLTAIAEHAAAALGNAKLLEEAREASALKSEFLSTVSHELRTPLNVIIGYTEMLRDGAAGPLSVPQGELFRRIETSSRELFDLIESVLQVGRLETSGAAPVLSPISFAGLLKTIEGSIGGLPRPPGVAFEWVVPQDVEGTLITDAPKVGLVVRNLVGNAFKFTAKGKVTLHLEPDDVHLRIAVTDTGPGIPPESIPQIFEMFRQLKGSEARGGVGLGLHIVKQVVTRLGGRVEVESAAGAGTTFRVELPRWQSARRPLRAVG